MKELGTVRRELGIRTIFNSLGPLANPAGATRQLIGVGRPELVRLLGDALAALGSERAVVFHSENGLDELVPGTPAAGVEVLDGWTRPWSFDPGMLTQRPVSVEELTGGDAAENAAMLARLLEGEPGARREAVLLNVGMALVVEGRAADLGEGCARARVSIESGAAAECFERLKQASRSA
jgi:anthranilate phosphoribosyltransferase